MIRQLAQSVRWYMLAALLAGSDTILSAQPCLWVHGSVGLSAAENFGANSQSISMHYHVGGFAYAVRYVNSDRIRGLVNWNTPKSNLDILQQIGVSVGFADESGFGLYGLTGGVGLVRGRHNEMKRYESFTVPGLTLEAWGGINLFDAVGFGLTVVGCVNAERDYGAVFGSLFLRVL